MAEAVFATAFAAVLSQVTTTLLAKKPPDPPTIEDFGDDSLTTAVTEDQRDRSTTRLAPSIAGANNARIGQPQTILGPGALV